MHYIRHLTTRLAPVERRHPPWSSVEGKVMQPWVWKKLKAGAKVKRHLLFADGLWSITARHHLEQAPAALAAALEEEPGYAHSRLKPGPEGAAVFGAVQQQQKASQAREYSKPVLPLQA